MKKSINSKLRVPKFRTVTNMVCIALFLSFTATWQLVIDISALSMQTMQSKHKKVFGAEKEKEIKEK